MSTAEPIPANSPVPVIFARDANAAALAPIARPAVAVIPQYSTWNDFTYYFTARLLVLLPQQQPIPFDMHLMVSGFGRTDGFFNQLLLHQPWVPIELANASYVGILDNVESYGSLIQLLGFARAITSLRLLGDAVVLRTEGMDTTRLPLFDTDQFHLGALRASSNYVAFRHGRRYLRPELQAPVADAATSFHMATNLLAADNPYDIDFDFRPDELNRDRVAVLIGRNGTGKTQLLLSLIRSQRSPQVGEPVVSTVFETAPTFSRLMVFSSVASDSYPRSIPPWDGVDYQYFSMIANTDTEADASTGALIDCLRDHRQFEPFTQGMPFSGPSRLNMLERSLAPLSFSKTIHLPLRDQSEPHDLFDVRTWQGRAYFPLFRSLNEQRQLQLVRMVDWSRSPVTFGLGEAPRTLSSGEQAMLRFAAQAVGSIEQGSMLLFDEPETHLHPNYVSDFMSILHTLLAATRSVAIIVTHSAYVVREVPRQRVRILSLNERVISINQPRLQTFGASIDSISQFVFGDSDMSHGYQDLLVDWVNRLGSEVTIERIVQDHGERLNPETLSYVAHLLRMRQQ
ncbi:AAA family ATPase [Bradyrhizobium sp. 197]|uniref:AAA family ATPase n=1 Tax=Bradyrhizobium sp. 197 TaxID=2782663 RepID=UPI001FF7759A|nr:AAA family ATPase [Bradyrhizobium sp. 197]